MENQAEQTGGGDHGRGVARDFRRLKADGGATADELREFIRRMRGKSPQQMLGILAQSGLVKSILVSAAGFVVVLSALTVVPYLLKPDTAAAANSPSASKQEQNRSTSPQPAETQAANPASSPATNAQGTPQSPDAEAAAAALGIDETKQAPPDKNPLEKDLDNLLDGVK
ncbi:MAG: hypothetical protein VB835_09570 [Pirellulales bacterium]